MAQFTKFDPTAEAPEIGTAASMTTIVACADQVEAALVDLEGAWQGFRDGPVPIASQSRDHAIQVNRIGATVDSLNTSVRRMRELAGEIREAT